MGAKMSPHMFFTFDDVLISPRESAIEPREASLRAVLVPGIWLENPFISAAMDRVTDARMAIALGKAGGLGILHRNCTSAFQVVMVKKVKRERLLVGAACGPFDLPRARALKNAGVSVLVIDSAHGHNLKIVRSAREIKRKTGLPLIVGNIATAEAVQSLSGIADAVKVGIGPGSICTTRIVSGVGIPQLSAILEVARAARRFKIHVIADGGMRTAGDIAKALAAGAHTVMLGNMFAGAREAPGKIIVRDGKKYKEYRGMGSARVLAENKSSDRYLIQGRKAIPEGVEGFVTCRGPVQNIVAELHSAVQVAFGYVGAKNISEFQKRAQFVRVTPASMRESVPHTLAILS